MIFGITSESVQAMSFDFFCNTTEAARPLLLVIASGIRDADWFID